MAFWNRIAPGPALLASLLLAACVSTPPEVESGQLAGDTASLLRIADSARQAGDPVAAIPIYKRAHKLSPEDPRPLIELGGTLNELGQFRAASEVWADALALDPNNAVALRGFGNTLTGLNQPHLALAKFQQALAIEEDAATYNGIGVANDMLGQPGEAQDSYRMGLALAPDELRLTNNLGLSLALSGEHDEAIRLLERAVTLPGATARHRQNLALAYGLAGDTDKAARMARIDLDETAVQRNLGYYAVLGGIRDHARKVAAVSNLTAQLAPLPALQQKTQPRQVSAVPNPTSAGRQEVAETTPVEAVPTPLNVEKPTLKPAAGESSELAARSTLAPASETDQEPSAFATPPAGAITSPEGEQTPASATVVAVAEAPEETNWYVQVASLRNRASAADEWTRLQQRQSELLGALGMRVWRTELSQGTYYRVLAGPLPSRGAAQSLCSQLKERNQDCLIRRI
ncbi:MAG: SPOR domain-containing protein [Alphaproteobacteria bacterium]